MQKAVKKEYAAICLWKFGAESPISPLLPLEKDPLEDLITTASAATRPDSHQAARTSSHQCTPARKLVRSVHQLTLGHETRLHTSCHQMCKLSTSTAFCCVVHSVLFSLCSCAHILASYLPFFCTAAALDI
ncbi:putative cytosolic oligopeptidase A [Dorcoceras hygrometricum]|uniref:Putative cytosolic oligopeptidase A n=1 Tax=Dorcoceras hygrometricum TaxID=472368 RepID=A0A2Z7CKX9_9LAMI|nr:putative cytosolic oligopeptidase A [Dorcoceras hygrometricum]